MRTLWVLILFGSLIIHHCFTTVSGEAEAAATVPKKDSQQSPSYSDCKPYVDAALKGDIPTSSSDQSAEIPPDETKDSPASASSLQDEKHDDENDDDDREVPTKPEVPPEITEDDDGDSSEENDGNEEGHEDKDSTEEQTDGNADTKGIEEESVEDDHEEPEINGLEVEDDDSKEDSKTTSPQESESSEEQDTPVPPPPPEPIVTKTKAPSPQQSKKAEVPKSNEKVDKTQDSKSNERHSGEAASKNPTPKDSQRDGTHSHSVAEDSDESVESQPSPSPKEKSKTISSPTKETKAEVKKSKPAPPPPPPPVDDEDNNDTNEDDESDEVPPPPPPKKSTKNNKVEKKESSEEVDKEPPVKQSKSVTPSTKSQKDKSVNTKLNEDDSSEEDESKDQIEDKTNSLEDESGEDDEESDEESEEDESEEVSSSYKARSRENIIRILGLEEASDVKKKDNLLDKVTTQTLKELKNTYEYAIKPLETLYKYRDLSNRHFGDSEVFSKPMVVFMGPWSGGKSTIINWLLGIQDEENALRTGADPSPAQFNILTHGSEEEVLDGTQLAADWTFSGLQKFGQSFLDRLRGRKLPNRLLEKVNLVEIPGILEIRKQVERSFPFNDACQWFIDRADVLFLIYDPAKLDIGPETEAILDQLKGRESQVRIVLNKADSIKPDELLRVQATLIWNISPLMASAEPPVLYVASLWDHPLRPEAPTSLLTAHENLFLKDISDATQKRVETRIAAARRFAVRVRNHAKMCDCYLNTYNNHRSFFSNKKRISDDIIDHPQNYHIYEGLSTLTNISRYDLPDPDTYRDFFRLNPVWEFPTLASTCTYFRGCPINKLDVAIAYDLPELLGRYRRQRESILTAPSGKLPEIKLKEVPEKKDEQPIDIPKGKNRWYKLPPEEAQEDVKTKSQAPPTPPASPPAPAEESAKGKSKWWKEVPVVVKEEPPKTQKVERPKVVEKKKVELLPREGYRIIPAKNKWHDAYYEEIKPKVIEQSAQPKKNKWYKT